MSISYKLEIDHKPKKDTTHSIYVRITKDRKIVRLNTGISVDIKDFNKIAPPGKWIRRTNPNYSSLNNKLKKKLTKAETDSDKMFELNPEALIKNVKLKAAKEFSNSDSFLAYFENYLTKEDKPKISFYYDKNLKTILKILTEYIHSAGMKDLSFNELNVTFLNDYENYLKVKRKISKYTIFCNLKKIRTIFQKALSDEKTKLNLPNPFLKKILKPGEKKSKLKLNIDDIRKIEALELEENSSLWHCRNYFMFQFYLAGTRIGDLMTLKWKNIKGDRIIYDISKNEVNNSVLLLDKAQIILKHYKKIGQTKNDYILPILPNFEKEPSEETLKKLISSKTAIQNKNLKKLQELAGIEVNISTHIARHSYANILLNGGASTEEIKTLLRHSSVVITERYLAGLKSETTDKVHSNILNAI